jgi:hypothetical protein
MPGDTCAAVIAARTVPLPPVVVEEATVGLRLSTAPSSAAFDRRRLMISLAAAAAAAAITAAIAIPASSASAVDSAIDAGAYAESDG